MRDSTFDHNGTTGPMPHQPKFKDRVCDSAKAPYTMSSVRTWLCILGRAVANYAVGLQLERFLDLFLKHNPQAATTRPSFLDDPRLALGDGPVSANFHGSHVTSHRFHRVIVLVLRVIHWEVKHARPLHSTTVKRTPLGLGYRLSLKARREDIHHQPLPCRQGMPLGWLRR